MQYNFRINFKQDSFHFLDCKKARFPAVCCLRVFTETARYNGKTVVLSTLMQTCLYLSRSQNNIVCMQYT